jgi:protein gp37
VGKTSIEWTDHSWPVVNGCRRVSAGCENCYAERLTATRLSQTPKYVGLAVMKPGPEQIRRRDLADGSVRLTKVQGAARPRWTGKARLWAQHLDMPLKLKKPSRIFVCDMGDLFFEEVPDGVIAAVFGVMAACPQHTFQVLTKRPGRAREWFRSMGGPGWAERVCHSEAAALLPNGLPHPRDNTWPLPNVWLGTSVEDQATADERIPVLLDVPAALRFVSAEPLLGPVDMGLRLGAVGGVAGHCVDIDGGWWHSPGTCVGASVNCSGRCCQRGIDWVIIGGESGPGARPFDLGWGRALVEQCAEAGTACFVKQLGANPGTVTRATSNVGIAGTAVSLRLRDRKGGDPAEWPEDLRVRDFPKTATPSNLPEKLEAGGKNAADLGAGRINRAGTAEDIVAALGPGKPLNRAELAEETGATEAAVRSSLTKLRRRGLVQVEDGFWTLVENDGDNACRSRLEPESCIDTPGLESEATPDA